VEAALANYFQKVSHIITLHDTRQEKDFKGKFGRLKKHLAGYLSSRADAIIAVSQDCAQNHLDFFPLWKRARCNVKVIYNGVDVERLTTAAKSFDQNTLRTQFGWSGEIRILGYFGRLMPEKGFLVLLDALRELARRGHADHIRLIATKDPYGYRGEYMREVERDEVLSRMVRFIDPVPDIAAVLPQIDVLVMPSLREACPLLPMEAIVLGVPVVGSDAIGLREVLKDTPSLAPQAENVAMLASSILEAATMHRKELAKCYTSDAYTRFNNLHLAEKLVQVYSNMARGQTHISFPLSEMN